MAFFQLDQRLDELLSDKNGDGKFDLASELMKQGMDL